MRVRQPEPFGPNREYRPGERCVYRGMVLIAGIWTAADARSADNNPVIFTQRCVRCKIKREDCPGNKAGVLPFICEREQTAGNVPEKP